MASLEERTGFRAARYSRPLVEASLPRLLALDLDSRARKTSDLGGVQVPHHPHGTENRWRAWKIQGELSKLGIHVSLSTISRYLPKATPDPDNPQRWTAFLRNHRDLITGMDFLVVPTVRFQLIYVWFVIDHGRRRILHFNVTENPTASWVIQQLRDAFPNEPTHRFLILDNDAIFATQVAASISSLGLAPNELRRNTRRIGSGRGRR